jgi:hypothetical protein
MEVFKFELKLKERSVELDGDDYTLYELTGKQRDVYMDNVAQRVRYVKGEAAGMKTMIGLQSSLLAMSLKDEKGVLVKEEVIQAYPGSVQGDLFAIAQKLSGLDAEEKMEEVKND